MMLLNQAPMMAAHPVGIDHHQYADLQPLALRRKRKAENQPDNNERLSKRLSLLNLEQSGSKLYVPIENPTAQSGTAPSYHPPPCARWPSAENDSMQLDDSKHKVYIYNLEDELSSDEAETDDGKLVFLPDIEDHLRTNRIPHHVLAGPSPDSAGRELVLYNVPASISVPEEQDSVRKAIIDARARIRERQQVQKAAEDYRRPGPPPVAAPGPAPRVLPAPTSAGYDQYLWAGMAARSDPEAMELD